MLKKRNQESWRSNGECIGLYIWFTVIYPQRTEGRDSFILKWTSPPLTLRVTVIMINIPGLPLLPVITTSTSTSTSCRTSTSNAACRDGSLSSFISLLTYSGLQITTTVTCISSTTIIISSTATVQHLSGQATMDGDIAGVRGGNTDMVVMHLLSLCLRL